MRQQSRRPHLPARSANVAAAATLVAVGLALPATALGLTTDVLDCDWDPAWANFRRRLVDNAADGYPLDAELTLEAEALLVEHNPMLSPDLDADYGASLGMQSFIRECNAPPPFNGEAEFASEPPFCIYGAVAALWVLARSGHPDRESLLKHAQFLLGWTMRLTMDFMESSGWPLSSLDIVANLQHPSEAFRLPVDLSKAFRPPEPPPSQLRLGGRLRLRVVVWEIGVHASLSAEPLHMWARFLPRVELVHRNLIQDQYPQWLPDKCATLYWYERLSCDTFEDDITELFRRRIPRSATSKDPVEDIDDFAAEFAAVAGSRLKDVGAFLCTVAYLCLLVRDLGIPVLGYFGHPLLFLAPRTDEAKAKIWSGFAQMVSSRSVAFAVSDPFLQMQYEYQVGAPRLPAIRAHALYMGATHFPARADEVLVVDRPHECVLLCLIQRLLPHSDNEALASWPRSEGRLRAAASGAYPYRFITRSLTDKSFRTFAQFRAVALWPYDMDLITFYEFYSMNMPLFMPGHLSKYLFQQDHMDYDGRWEARQGHHAEEPMWPDGDASPFNETSVKTAHLLMGFTDYFRFPEVQHFQSIPDLLSQLVSVDFFAVVQGMARANQEALEESATAWRERLLHATAWPLGP